MTGRGSTANGSCPIRMTSPVRRRRSRIGTHGFIAQETWRTGTATGELEFVGRVDGQVKVRGFRVELGEIEAVLESHPEVEQAVASVVGAESQAGDERQLAAHVTLKSATSGGPADHPVDAEADAVAVSDAAGGLAAELHQFLRDRLPVHSVPSAIVPLDRLPMSPNGKVDRSALPAPRRVGSASGRPPRNDAERWLADLWSELLQVDQVGIHDNFFELGGDSLKAVQLVSRAASQGVHLPAHQLFQSQTIAELAAAFEREAADGSSEVSPKMQDLDDAIMAPLQEGDKEAPLFLIHPAGGNVFPYVELARRLPRDLPVVGIQARGLVDDRSPHQSVEEMAVDYLAAIRRAQPAGPYRLGGWSFGGLVAYQIAALLAAEGEEVEPVVVLDVGADAADHDDQAGLAELQDLLGLEEQLSLPEFEALSPDQQLAHFRPRIEAAGLVDQDAAEDIGRRMLAVLKANATAGRAYRPPVADVSVCVLQADQGGPQDMGASWRRVARGGVHAFQTRGDHLSMMQRPQVGALARQIQAMMSGVEPHGVTIVHGAVGNAAAAPAPKV